MSIYRCQVCKEYTRTPWRRIGLGSVCSEECDATLRARQRGGQPRQQARGAREGAPSLDNAYSSVGRPPTTSTFSSDGSADPGSATLNEHGNDSAEPPSATGRVSSTGAAGESRLATRGSTGAGDPRRPTAEPASSTSAAAAATQHGILDTSAGDPRHAQGLGSAESDPRHERVRAESHERPRREVSAGSAAPDPRPEVRAGSAGPHPRRLASALRDEIIARDGRCRFCGTTANLHVHHIVYLSQGGGDEPTNLITLCLRHHDVVHRDKRRWKPVCEAYIELYYQEGRRTFLLALDRRLTETPRRPG